MVKPQYLTKYGKIKQGIQVMYNKQQGFAIGVGNWAFS